MEQRRQMLAADSKLSPFKLPTGRRSRRSSSTPATAGRGRSPPADMPSTEVQADIGSVTVGTAPHPAGQLVVGSVEQEQQQEEAAPALELTAACEGFEATLGEVLPLAAPPAAQPAEQVSC